jgi:hypothetical protein
MFVWFRYLYRKKFFSSPLYFQLITTFSVETVVITEQVCVFMHVGKLGRDVDYIHTYIL